MEEQIVSNLATKRVIEVWDGKDPKLLAHQKVMEICEMISHNASPAEMTKHAIQVGFLTATNAEFKAEFDRIISLVRNGAAVDVTN